MTDLSIALVGLPSVGKTIVFNLVANQSLDSGSHPLPTVKPSRAVITVEDDRMRRVAEIIQPAELFPLKVEIIDTPGIIEGVSEEREGAQEGLNALREADVLAHVLRDFSSASVPHLFDDRNYSRDIRVVENELIHADSAAVNREIQKLEKLRRRAHQVYEAEYTLVRSVAEFLESGQPLRIKPWPTEFFDAFKQLNLITHRPQFYVINYGDGESPEFTHVAAGEQKQLFQDSVIETVCAQIEYEMLQLDEVERQDFQELYPSLRFSRSLFPWWAIRALNMVTYFTFGRLGLKEWVIASGSNALLAAKRLHTDIAKGLIATEVFSTENLLSYGSVEEIKRQGKLRVEGRDYQIKDGDILYFRFSK